MKILLIFGAVLLAGMIGTHLAGHPAGWGYLLFLLPAVCGGISYFLLHDLAGFQQLLPSAAGFFAAFLFPFLKTGNETVWETLFSPLAAAGIVIFLTGLLRLLHYIRTTLQNFRDIAAGKIPQQAVYEEE